MRNALLFLGALILFAPVAVQAQQSGSSAERRAAMQARRDSLEAEVVRKFIHRLTNDLKLDAAQRAETERVLHESGAQRRELSRASMQLRGRIYGALRNEGATDAEFIRLLAEHEALRTREHELWRHDQDRLAHFLTPRQRAHFVLSWAKFQEDMSDILSRRMRPQSDGRDGDRRDSDRSGRDSHS